jgi:hypothetical protein
MSTPLFDHQVAFLKDIPKLLQYLWDHGFTVTGGELLRTAEQQQLYLQQGKSRTLDSNHLKKTAIDLNIFLDGNFATKPQLQSVGDYWESLHPLNRWGGNFKTFQDTPHFERNVTQDK